VCVVVGLACTACNNLSGWGVIINDVSELDYSAPIQRDNKIRRPINCKNHDFLFTFTVSSETLKSKRQENQNLLKMGYKTKAKNIL
jgi:hypothetical protein